MKATFTTFFCALFTITCIAQVHDSYQIRYSNKEYKTVIKIAEQRLKDNPTDSVATYYLGLSYANLNNHKKAIENFKATEKNGYNRLSTLFWLAKSYLAEKNIELALQALETLDDLKVGFTKKLEEPIFDIIKDNKRFKAVKFSIYKRASPCKYDDNYKKFNFWVGEWDVYQNGQKIAESSITKSNGDCGILENWMPTNSNGGNSISYYDTSDKKWKQNWVANGSVSHFEEPKDYTSGDMQLIARNANTWYKMVYTHDKEEDTVNQVMLSSTNKGKTWSKIFNGLYKRKHK